MRTDASIGVNIPLNQCFTIKSKKYEWIKLESESEGRGAKKLFFKISKEQILTAFNQELITKNTLIFDEKMQRVNLDEFYKNI